MKNLIIAVTAMVILSACNATQPPPYQADREPEDRTMYSGVEGLAQHQKDQRYLMDKELTDKCSAAKVDLAVAESEQNETEIKRQSDIIKRACT